MLRLVGAGGGKNSYLVAITDDDINDVNIVVIPCGYRGSLWGLNDLATFTGC